MKQRELSKITGLSQAYLSKYLRGDRNCSLKTAKLLTGVFGKDPIFWMESSADQRRAIMCGPDNNRADFQAAGHEVSPKPKTL